MSLFGRSPSPISGWCHLWTAPYYWFVIFFRDLGIFTSMFKTYGSLLQSLSSSWWCSTSNWCKVCRNRLVHRQGWLDTNSEKLWKNHFINCKQQFFFSNFFCTYLIQFLKGWQLFRMELMVDLENWVIIHVNSFLFWRHQDEYLNDGFLEKNYYIILYKIFIPIYTNIEKWSLKDSKENKFRIHVKNISKDIGLT